jgi:hypothetical protein
MFQSEFWPAPGLFLSAATTGTASTMYPITIRR